MSKQTTKKLNKILKELKDVSQYDITVTLVETNEKANFNVEAFNKKQAKTLAVIKADSLYGPDSYMLKKVKKV